MKHLKVTTLILVLVLVLSFALTGCTGREETTDNSDQTEVAAEKTEEVKRRGEGRRSRAEMVRNRFYRAG